mmetsp:Transcript_54225/g.126684  ORF Transcript_54225/g.126684 Transcript_54225/m.126684 type:complete len:93 (+) Transcript_54225:132-410(+)
MPEVERKALKAKHKQLQKKVRMLGQRLSRTKDALCRTEKEIAFLLVKQAQLDGVSQTQDAAGIQSPQVGGTSSAEVTNQSIDSLLDMGAADA